MNILNIFKSKNIRIATAGSLLIKFLSAFFGFLSAVLLARLLGLEGFGVYTIAFTTITVLSVPVSLGLPTLITRYLSKYDVERNDAGIKGLLIKSNQIVYLSTSLIVLFAFITYLMWWKNLDKELVKTIWLGFILLPLLGLGSLRAAALRGMRLIILGQLPDTLLRNFLLCSGLLLFFLFDYTLTPSLAMIIHIVAATIAYIVGYVFLWKYVLFNLKEIKPVFYTNFWIKEAVPFSINSGIQVFKGRFLIYILAIFGSLEAVAIFEVALRGASLVAFTLDALNNAISPYISSAFERKNMIALQSIVTKTSRIIFLFALPVVLIFIIGGENLLTILFGGDFKIAYWPLVILCLGQLVNAVTGTVGLVLNMTGRQSYLTKVLLIRTILNLISSIPIVIYYDVLGASILYSAILILQNIILVLYIKNKMNINTTVF